MPAYRRCGSSTGVVSEWPERIAYGGFYGGLDLILRYMY